MRFCFIQTYRAITFCRLCVELRQSACFIFVKRKAHFQCNIYVCLCSTNIVHSVYWTTVSPLENLYAELLGGEQSGTQVFILAFEYDCILNFCAFMPSLREPRSAQAFSVNYLSSQPRRMFGTEYFVCQVFMAHSAALCQAAFQFLLAIWWASRLLCPLFLNI